MSTAVTSQDIDLHHAIGLYDAAHLLRCTLGRTPVLETVRRWIVRGIARPEGRVYLRAVLVNGEWLTTRDWVAEFARVRG